MIIQPSPSIFVNYPGRLRNRKKNKYFRVLFRNFWNKNPTKPMIIILINSLGLLVLLLDIINNYIRNIKNGIVTNTISHTES